jgi:hypothetical protein
MVRRSGPVRPSHRLSVASPYSRESKVRAAPGIRPTPSARSIPTGPMVLGDDDGGYSSQSDARVPADEEDVEDEEDDDQGDGGDRSGTAGGAVQSLSGSFSMSNSIKIPKPMGEAGRSGSGGYNLQEKLGWDTPQFRQVQVSFFRGVSVTNLIIFSLSQKHMQTIIAKYCDLNLSYSKQSKVARTNVHNEVSIVNT